MTLPLSALALQVILWHAYRGGEELALSQAVAQYNAQTPGVEVRAVPVPFDAYAQKRAAAIPRGNGPDLFIAAHHGIGQWRRDGLIAAYRDPLDASAFLDGTTSPLMRDGHSWGRPLGAKCLVLYYRTDLLAAAPRTTDELFAAVSGRYALAYETGNFYDHAVWVHAFGGQILGEVHGVLRPVLETPAEERALAWVREQAARGRLPGDASSATATQLFRDGRAAATISGPWLLGELPASLPFGITPLPIVSEAGAPARPLLEIEAVFLSASAREPVEAERFATWLATAGASVRAKVGRQIVAARAAWDDPEIGGDRLLVAFRAQLSQTVPWSTEPAMAVVFEPAQEALRKALRGDLDVRAALAAADQRIGRALAPPPQAKDPVPYVIGLVLVIGGVVIASRRRRTADGDGKRRTAGGRRRTADGDGKRRTADGGGNGDGNGDGDGDSPSSRPWLYLSPAVLCLVLLVFVPFSVGAAMSLFHHVPGPDGGRYLFVGFDNFVTLLGSRDQPLSDPLSFYFTLIVTIAWTLVNIALHVLIGVTLALLLRDPLLRLRGIYRVLLIVPWAMPSYITALVWKGMFNRQLGAINALLALVGIPPVAWFAHFTTAFAANVITNVWLGFPFMMVVTLGALARIPRELEEAAILDGATGWQRLRHVILPLLRPALMPSVVLGAVWTFNMFNVVFLVSGGEPDGATEILISQAYRWAFSAGRGERYGYAAAYAVVIFLLLWAQTKLSRRLTEVEA